MPDSWKDNHALYLIVVGALAWLVPGAGHFLLDKRRQAIVICVAVLLTFLVGLYVGSVGVIDPVGAKPWYAAQLMNTPAVALLARISTAGNYPVYGRPNEIGQIYTSIAGLLNLLCIVNAIYLAHLRGVEKARA
ncbi:MAG: hypothetical protein JW993_06575 [Sedimentisphaerales bacterium]|nr:hypothetical protein [Sedimentisphaerales bacterium]